MDNSKPAHPASLIRLARAMLIGTTFSWGLSFPLVRALELAQHAHVPALPDPALAAADIAMRFGVSALMLMTFYGAQLLTITRRESSQAVGLAFFAGIGIWMQTLGLAWSDASITAFLTQLYSLFVPIIVAVRDRHPPSLRVQVACILVLAGAALLSPGLVTHFTLGAGELVTIGSTIFLAGQIVWVERPIFAGNRAGVVTILMFALMAIGFSLVFALGGGSATAAGQLFGTTSLVELALSTVILCTLFNFLIMNAWQRYITATEAGLIYCIEPVVAAYLSGFFPGWISRVAGINYANELWTWSLLAGGLIIVGATVLVATEPQKK